LISRSTAILFLAVATLSRTCLSQTGAQGSHAKGLRKASGAEPSRHIAANGNVAKPKPAKAITSSIASAETHWAFRPPTLPEVPRAFPPYSNPIDRFLVNALKQKSLAYSPPADKRTLLRRVTFDLIGLPPTPREMDAFLADRSPDAYDKVVDRLLADPRFGEKSARQWLDLAGYADSEGVLQEDRVRPNAWRYRDYVIRSFNADKPYDRFLREQIAGDELVDYHGAPKWTPEIEDAVTATGFLRTAVDATRDDFNTHQFTEYQTRMLNDTQTILVSATLGITLQCARCHDHKFEPFSQRDYYRMQAFLAGAIRPDGKLLPTNRRQIPAATDAEQQTAKASNAKVDEAVKQIAAKDAALIADYRRRNLEGHPAGIPEADRASVAAAALAVDAQRTPAQKALLVKYKAQVEATPEALAAAFPEFKMKHAELEHERANQEKQRIVQTEIRALYDQDAAPPPTVIRIRGEWTRPGEQVGPGIPAVLDDPKSPFHVPAPQAGSITSGRRRALADWITRADNPLTARVIVNRIWAQHFGVGIVASSDNFGRSGTKPSNQSLLDWLACGLTRGLNGNAPWTLKAVHRAIVTSAAYKQSSAFRASAATIDPEDKLLWRQRPHRIEAEYIRDSVLAVAGALDDKMYGEPVAELTRPTGEIVPISEEKQGRRSIYLLVRRSMPVTLLNTFDAPVMETNCTRRITSTTATQALALLNSAFIDAQARTFAARVQKLTAEADRITKVLLPISGLKLDTTWQRTRLIVSAYRLALARPPTTQEDATALTFLATQAARYTAADSRASKEAVEQKALADLCAALFCSNEFVYID